MDEQINGEEMAKIIEKLQRIETGLNEKIDAKIVKMAEYEQKMKEEMTEMRNEIGKILEEKRILQNRFEEIKAEEKQNQPNPESSAISIEKMQQRKRAIGKDGEELTKEATQSKFTEKGVPNWLIEVLAWIRRIEMANSALSTSSWAFKELCWPKLHGQVKPHYVDAIGFYYGDDERERAILYRFPDGVRAAPEYSILYKFPEEIKATPEYFGNTQIIPIATVPPPDYILGFEEIHLCFLNNEVIQFMENAIIKVENIRLKPTAEDVYGWERERSEMLAMHRLLTIFSGKLFELDFMHVHHSRTDYDYFHHVFPYVFDETQQLFLTTDDDERTNFVFNWLTKQRKFGDKKSRYLRLCIYIDEVPAFIERVKQEFVNSTKPNTFLMVVIRNLNIPEFTIENHQTDEQLILYRKKGNEEHCIARYGKREEDKKMKMENKFFDDDELVTNIYLSIKEFGAFI